MERIYHFTSGLNWQGIQYTKNLEPHSTPEIPLLNLPTNPYNAHQMKRIDEIIASNLDYWKGNFVVGIPESGIGAWKEFELFDRIITHCKDGVTNKVILLSFSLNEENGTYIRDHSYFSPKRFTELYNKDLSDFTTLLLGGEEGDIERLLKQFELCADSVVSLEDYKDSYEVPELWIPHQISLDSLEMEDQFDFWGSWSYL